MKLLKKVSVVLLSLTLLGSSLYTSKVQAAELKENKNIAEGVNIDLNSPQPNVKISEPMTYEEVISEISINQNISLEDAKESFGHNFSSARNIVQPRYTDWINVSYTLSVDAGRYQPQVVFYCRINGYGNYRGIQAIEHVSMNRGSNGVSKIFNGEVYVHLRDAATIYFLVNGDFYNTGTSSYGAEVNIPVSSTGTSVKLQATFTSDYYAYLYQNGTINFR